MDIVIGKIFFLISAAWAFIVLFRIAVSLLSHRGRDFPPPSAPMIYPEKPKRMHLN
jgi:hypothetical protein